MMFNKGKMRCCALLDEGIAMRRNSSSKLKTTISNNARPPKYRSHQRLHVATLRSSATSEVTVTKIISRCNQ
eukprot:11877-Eustigmatos_ZCMA.PRE.1